MQIPPVYKDTIKRNDFSDCCNIRIYRMRFGFMGLVAKEKTHVSIKITHSGKEVIVSRDNSSNTFVHDSIATRYSFNLYPDGTFKVQDNGNIDEAAGNELRCPWAVCR